MEEKKFISFHDQIARNKRNSYLLFIFIFLVFMALGWVIAQIYDPSLTFIILIFAIIFSLAYTWGTYENSATIVLKSVNAYPAAGEKFRHLRNMVEGLALGAGLPTPKVYIMPSKDINAFATGKDPQNSVVCVTEGALENLTDSELEGVLAHEMTHIGNYDIRFVTLVAVMVGIIAIASEIFLRSMWYTGGGSGRRGKGSAYIIIIGIILAILAPIIVRLVQLAISRRREFAADAGAVQLTRYPGGLISALEKIKTAYSTRGVKTKVNEAVAPMFFADPIRKRMVNLFNTHPSIDKRIEVLKRM
jgi:heat shock protein HtpX